MAHAVHWLAGRCSQYEKAVADLSVEVSGQSPFVEASPGKLGIAASVIHLESVAMALGHAR